MKVLQRLKKPYCSVNTVVSSGTEEMKSKQGKCLPSVVPASVSHKANWWQDPWGISVAVHWVSGYFSLLPFFHINNSLHWNIAWLPQPKPPSFIVVNTQGGYLHRVVRGDSITDWNVKMQPWEPAQFMLFAWHPHEGVFKSIIGKGILASLFFYVHSQFKRCVTITFFSIPAHEMQNLQARYWLAWLVFYIFAQVKFSSARKLVTRVADMYCDSWRIMPLWVSSRTSLLTLLPNQYNGQTSLPRNNTFVYHESFISLATVKS